MAKGKGNRQQEIKRIRKRNAEDSSLEDCTPSKTDVSDQVDSEGAERNDANKAKTNGSENKIVPNNKNSDGESNGKAETPLRTQDIKIPGNGSLEGGCNKAPADSYDEEQSESNDVDEKPASNSLDPESSLPRKRRKQPSRKLLLQKEEIEELKEIENRLPKHNDRRHPKRKASLAGMGTLYKKARLRKLDSEDEKVVIERARKKGLPARWTVAFHKDWNRKVWISPDRSRICDTVPRAILISQKMAFVTNADDVDGVSFDEYDKSDDEEGIDEEVEECGSFVITKETTTPRNDPASLLIANSEELHELSADQERAAMKKGRSKGLRGNGWRCAWNSKFKRKNWVSPQGKLFGNLSRAIEKQDDWIMKEEKRKLKENRKMQEIEREWQKQFKRLTKYKRKHGNTLVPDNSERYAQLRTWARRQRRQYFRVQKGGRSSLTPEQIAALNQIGFQWEVEKIPKGPTKNKEVITFAAPEQAMAPSARPPLDGSIFDNAPEEMFTRRHVLFSDMQPPLVSSARIPIKFVNPVKKLPNGNLGTESYCREVKLYLQTWYGIGEGC